MQIFLNGEPLALAENFSIQKFTSHTTDKSDMSNILYKVYMGKTVICHTIYLESLAGGKFGELTLFEHLVKESLANQ